MWKKPESEIAPITPTPVKTVNTQKARIGAGLTLKGELSGKEDVIIEGRVEGKVSLSGQSVIVEKSGRVIGDVFASNISVSGEVHGDISGTAQVVLLETGRVEGDIRAKSVTIETGAQFKGSVDMQSVEDVPSPKGPAQIHPTKTEKTNGAPRPANAN